MVICVWRWTTTTTNQCGHIPDITDSPFPSLQPPVPSVATTSSPEAWFVSLRDSNDVDLGTFIVSEPTTLTYTFTELKKGSEYSVQVAGNNSRGIGVFSDFVTNSTIVDRE